MSRRRSQSVSKFKMWQSVRPKGPDGLDGLLTTLAASTNNRHHPWITSSIRGYHELSCKFTSRFLTSLWIVIVPHFTEDKNGYLWQHRTDTRVTEFMNSFFILSQPTEPSEVKLRKYIHVHYKCKDERTWCLTCRCACVKAEVNCSIACHRAKNEWRFEIGRRKRRIVRRKVNGSLRILVGKWKSLLNKNPW